MIELRNYTKSELAKILGTNDREGMLRKLKSWGIRHDEPQGRGENMTVNITDISDPFKVLALTELGASPYVDFRKLRNYLYYFLNDEEFASMPDEVKENRLKHEGKCLSRQTISKYTDYLRSLGVISYSTDQFIYYFAHKGNQRITDRKEYLDAWYQYWKDKDDGMNSGEAIYRMKQAHGGVARRQPIPEYSPWSKPLIEKLNDCIQVSIERELEAFEKN